MFLFISLFFCVLAILCFGYILRVHSRNNQTLLDYSGAAGHHEENGKLNVVLAPLLAVRTATDPAKVLNVTELRIEADLAMAPTEPKIRLVLAPISPWSPFLARLMETLNECIGRYMKHPERNQQKAANLKTVHRDLTVDRHLQVWRKIFRGFDSFPVVFGFLICAWLIFAWTCFALYVRFGSIPVKENSEEAIYALRYLGTFISVALINVALLLTVTAWTVPRSLLFAAASFGFIGLCLFFGAIFHPYRVQLLFAVPAFLVFVVYTLWLLWHWLPVKAEPLMKGPSLDQTIQDSAPLDICFYFILFQFSAVLVYFAAFCLGDAFLHWISCRTSFILETVSELILVGLNSFLLIRLWFRVERNMIQSVLFFHGFVCEWDSLLMKNSGEPLEDRDDAELRFHPSLCPKLVEDVVSNHQTRAVQPVRPDLPSVKGRPPPRSVPGR